MDGKYIVWARGDMDSSDIIIRRNTLRECIDEVDWLVSRGIDRKVICIVEELVDFGEEG